MSFIAKSRLVGAAVLAFAFITGGAASAQTVLKFSHTDQAAGIRQASAELFASKVAEYTQGRYVVKIFPAGQLGNDPKAIEQLQLGGVDFTVSATGSYATHVPTLNLTMLPYLVESYEQGWKLYDESPWIKAQFSKAPEKGFRILATWEAGFRDITTKTPVMTPADARGMKLRTFPNEMMRWTLEAIGFSVQVMPLSEVYLAIQQGAVSGQENPIDTIYSNMFYEVAGYVALTRHVYSPIPLAISEKTWQKLSEADRVAITRAAQEAAVYSRNQVREAETVQIADMKAHGAIINSPPIEPFREAVKPAYEKAKGKYGTDVDSLLTDAEVVRKALPVTSK